MVVELNDFSKKEGKKSTYLNEEGASVFEAAPDPPVSDDDDVDDEMESEQLPLRSLLYVPPIASPAHPRLRLPLLERAVVAGTSCKWWCNAFPAARVGERMAFMGEVAWVRLERRRRRRGCAVDVVVVIVVVDDDDDDEAAIAGSDEPTAPLIACGDCCIGVVCPSSPCIDDVGVALLRSRVCRRVEATNSLISTSIIDSSGRAIGEEGEGEDGLTKSSASESEKSELTVSRRRWRRGVCGARRPEEKKEE